MRVAAYDIAGAESPLSNTVKVGIVSESPKRRYNVGPNYPNPARNSTTITYSLKEETPVRIELYDVLGRRVRVLLDERKKAGEHQVRCSVRDLASGVYFYRVEAKDFKDTGKMVVVH
jgi:hypothetical protein